MATQDRCCTIVPYFRVHEGQMERFREMCDQFVETAKTEPGCLYYGFSFNGAEAHCREGYRDADAALIHLDNVGSLLTEVMKIADVTRLEVHGPESELSRLRGPLEAFSPAFFTLEYGFRR